MGISKGRGTLDGAFGGGVGGAAWWGRGGVRERWKIWVVCWWEWKGWGYGGERGWREKRRKSGERKRGDGALLTEKLNRGVKIRVLVRKAESIRVVQDTFGEVFDMIRAGSGLLGKVFDNRMHKHWHSTASVHTCYLILVQRPTTLLYTQTINNTTCNCKPRRTPALPLTTHTLLKRQ